MLHRAQCEAEMNQFALDFTKAATGRELRDLGMQQATTNADRAVLGWSEMAYGYLLEWLAYHAEAFTGEQVREFAMQRGCQEPTHKRAWGGVMMRAARERKIHKIGTAQVTNPKAHMANAALWRRASA